MPALLRVVKLRIFLTLRWKGKRKCRPSPQMSNGASTSTLVRMFQCTARATYHPTRVLLQASEHVYGAPPRPSFPVGAAQW